MGDLLEAIAHAHSARETRLSVIAQNANLPYDRFIRYVVKLQQRGALHPGDPTRLTADGEHILERFVAWRAALETIRADTID